MKKKKIMSNTIMCEMAKIMKVNGSIMKENENESMKKK